MMKHKRTEGRKRQIGQVTWATAMLGVAGLVLCTGCATTRDRVLGFGEKSPLAGEWAGPMTLEVRWTAQGGARRTNTKVAQIKETVIRSDGSFDLNRTMMAMMGDLRGLRKTGDQVPVKGSKGQAGTLRVVWCEYTSTTSQMAVEIRSDEENVDNADGSTPTSSDCSLLYSSARLNDDGTLSYHRSILLTPTQESVVTAGVLKRMPSRDLAKLAKQAMADYPEPPWIINKKFTRRKLKTAAGNEYILLTPRKSKGPMPLIVSIPPSPGAESVDDDIECWWRYHVDRFKIAVAIPILNRPYVFDFDFFGYKLKENTTIAAAHAKTVRDVTAAAKRIISPTRTSLVGRSNATVIAGALWKEDNRQFDSLAMMAYPVFSHNPPPGPPKPVVRKDAPISILYVVASGKSAVKDGKEMIKMYRDCGYTNVMECTTNDLQVDMNEARMTALALGRKFKGLKIGIKELEEQKP